MGEMVEFPSNGTTVGGYLASPEVGAGPGVVVIQEWWGLVDHVKDVCDRFAAEGFTALAPDLYHGATTAEPDEAGKLMMAMNLERAARDMAGAVDHLAGHDSVRGQGVGVVGFCMGGGLALWLATLRSDQVRAVVAFYGVIPWDAAQPDWSRLAAAVQGHYAENDGSAPPEHVAAMEARLKDLGISVEMFIYPNTDHGFFNDTRPEAYSEEAARQAWIRTLEFLRRQLG
ncbi:MAG: dienelactone hydrolase family protein [Actinomycetota bacterium]|nr:dienelactone hydrolase family protein [Actinomycetota bacterium]